MPPWKLQWKSLKLRVTMRRSLARPSQKASSSSISGVSHRARIGTIGTLSALRSCGLARGTLSSSPPCPQQALRKFSATTNLSSHSLPTFTREESYLANSSLLTSILFVTCSSLVCGQLRSRTKLSPTTAVYSLSTRSLLHCVKSTRQCGRSSRSA